MVTNNLTNVITASVGKVLQGAGVGVPPIYSVPTYPSASGTARKILVSDGTNLVYSTETYATPGASGNVLTSNVTNWISSVAPGGYVILLSTLLANPADSGVYYMPLVSALTQSPTNFINSKYYISKSATIKVFYGIFSVGGTLGSSENVTMDILVNGVFAETVSSTVKLTASIVTFNNTALSTSVSAGDYIQLRMTCPAWATNPISVSMTGTFYLL